MTIAGNGNMVVDGEVVSKGFTAKSGQITTNDGGIELFHASPYVDFHFNKSAKDYTARIINDAEDQLTFDCRSVRALRDFTARGSIRGCYNDAFVARPLKIRLVEMARYLKHHLLSQGLTQLVTLRVALCGLRNIGI